MGTWPVANREEGDDPGNEVGKRIEVMKVNDVFNLTKS